MNMLMFKVIFAQYKAYFVMALIISVCAICFGAGVGFSKNKSDLKIANLSKMHATQLKLIDDAKRLAFDEKQTHINNLQLEFSIADQNRNEVLKNAQLEIAKRDASIHDLSVKLRVKVKRPVCGTDGKDISTEGHDGTDFAELEPETSVRILSYTDEGNKAIVNLTACQGLIRMCAKHKQCPFVFQ